MNCTIYYVHCIMHFNISCYNLANILNNYVVLLNVTEQLHQLVCEQSNFFNAFT